MATQLISVLALLLLYNSHLAYASRNDVAATLRALSAPWEEFRLEYCPDCISLCRHVKERQQAAREGRVQASRVPDWVSRKAHDKRGMLEATIGAIV